MIDGVDTRNKKVEDFFNAVYEKEAVSMSKISAWKRNYYAEIENDNLFNSDHYPNQDERIDAMFPGMPETPRSVIALAAYKHRAKPIADGGHGDEGTEERIVELEASVQGTEYEEFGTDQWWSN